MLRIIPAFFLLAAAAFPLDDLFPFAIDQDRLSGAPDFSFLNHPLGPADRVFVRDGHFHRVGPDLKPDTGDDERVRFFGVNFAFGASFPEPRDAARIARRLRRLGVNLVRLHHMDTSPDRDPENCGSILTTGPYPTLNPLAVKRLRVFLDALRAEGIYVNLNLHVGYEFRPDADKVPALPGGQKIPTHSKPLHIFHPRMVELQTEFTRTLMGALKLKGDPVLAMVEANNETSLLEAYGRRALEKVLQGDYKAELDRQYEVFLKSRNKARGETDEDDYLLFLADRDRAYLEAMRRAVRAATDSLVPMAGTQMGYGGLQNLDTHEAMDYQDNHFYIDHYSFPHEAWDSRDWRIRDSSAAGQGMSAFFNMAVSREAGKPYTVSEFNQQWPNRQAAEIDPELAAFGAFQDWDAILHFAYSHGRAWDKGTPGGFDINGDWTKFANLGQSAWLFRAGAVAAGRAPVVIPVAEPLRSRFGRDRKVGGVSSFLSGTVGLDAATAMIHPVAVKRDETGGVPESVKAKPASPYRSDTGELTYDREGKLFVIETPQAAGVFGFPAGKAVTAGAITVELGAGARGFVSLLVTALDGKPLEASRRMLLSTPGYTLCSIEGADPPRPQRLVNYGDSKDWWTLEPYAAFPGKPSGSLDGGRAPVWMERVESHVTLRSSAKRITAYPLDGAGARLAPLPEADVRGVEGGFRMHLRAPSPWYEIVTEGKP